MSNHFFSDLRSVLPLISVAAPTRTSATSKINKRFPEENKEAGALFESLTLNDYEKQLAAAALLLPFKSVPFVGDLYLPGFGVFEQSCSYNPDDLGSITNPPERINVLTPHPSYPPIQFGLQRWLYLVDKSRSKRPEPFDPRPYMK